MSIQRPVSKALACQSCQQWILRSFICAVGGVPSVQQRTPMHSSRRPFSIAHRRRNEFQRTKDDEEHPLNDINDTYAESTTNAEPQSINKDRPNELPQNESLPWYLQHQPPIPRHDSPLSSRQQLPSLPPNAPPILDPLMQHVSIELGIDDLNLLDLRGLDPPPALGANLLMLVGTARSEKHLHVSADRLCRWLRSTYSLSPHADGLLGRNELKLKLKRRAKRSKLLSAVGAKATAQTEIDDGIRTGWVCVNVGRVEGGEVAGGQKRDFVGFGPIEEGCTIVVQMLTEEKRAEIDLEALWEDEIVRAQRKKEREVERSNEAEDASNEAVTGQVTESGPAPSSTGYHHFAAVSTSTVGQAMRAYHTSARKLQASPAIEPAHTQDMSAIPINPAEDQAVEYASSASLLEVMLKGLKAMTPAQTLNTLGPNILGASAHLNLHHQTPHKSKSEPAAEALEYAPVTPFLRRFYDLMPSYPGPEHWHAHVELLALARASGHRECHSHILIAQLQNMQIAGLVPEERTFKLVIESVLGPMHKDQEPYDGINLLPSPKKLESILAVLEDMEACGYDAVHPSILSSISKACGGEAANVDFESTISSLNLARLTYLTRTGQWDAFWRTWRSYPARFLPRAASMYTVLFNAVGEGRISDVRAASDVLREKLEEMEMEEPIVRVEESRELAAVIIRAVKFVEPLLKEGSTGEGAAEEWKRWHERCLSVVRGSG